MRVHIESFGFASMHGITIDFDRGSSKIRRVKIGDVAYVGNASTLAAWLLNFAARRASGKHLRDGLPRTQGKKHGGVGGFVEMTPRDAASPSDGDTPVSGKRRFIRFGVGSLKTAFAVEGVEITMRAEASNGKASGKEEAVPRNGTSARDEGGEDKPKKKSGMTRYKWRLIRGVASFVEINVASFKVLEDDAEALFCDRMTMEATRSTGASLSGLVTTRVLRGKQGWSMTDANFHLTAEFDAESKSITPAHVGLSGATLVVRKSRELEKNGDSSSRGQVGSSPEVKNGETTTTTTTNKQHRAIAALLKAPRKCKLEFKRVIFENKDDGAPLTCTILDMRSSIERMSTGSSRSFFRKKEVVSPFDAETYQVDTWSDFKFAFDEATVAQGKSKQLFQAKKASACATMALVDVGDRDHEKLPALASVSIDACDARHYHETCALVAALKSNDKSKKNGEKEKKKSSSNPWELLDLNVACHREMKMTTFDEQASATSYFSVQDVRGRFGNLIGDGAESLRVDTAAERRGVCSASKMQITLEGYDPVLRAETVGLAHSQEGNAVEISGMTVDVNVHERHAIGEKFKDVVAEMKKTANSAKKPKVEGENATESVKKTTPVRLILMDTSFVGRCKMDPYSNFGEIPQNSRGSDQVECGFTLACPLADVSRSPSGTVKLNTGGFTVSMHDTIERARRDATDKEPAWTERINYESVSLETNRVFMAGSFDVEYEKIEDQAKTRVALESVAFDWEPDAHFLALEMRELIKSPAGASESTRKEKQSKTKGDIIVSMCDVEGSFFVTPGACAKISFQKLDADVRKKQCRVQQSSFGMNGYTIMEMGSVRVAPGSAERTVPHVPFITAEDDEDIDNRQKYSVDMHRVKCMLPAGLDLGDAMVAMIAGEQALREVLKQTSKPKKLRLSLSPGEPVEASWLSEVKLPVKELNLNVNGVEIEVQDSDDLERSLRAKQAVLGSYMAQLGFNDNFEEVLKDASEIYLKHKEFLASGGGPALRITFDKVHSVSAWEGGRGNGDELAHMAAAHVRRVDAPFSDTVSLQMQNVLSMCATLSGGRFCLADVSECPPFTFRELTMSGTFVQARQHAPRILTGQVPMAVGRRRWTMANGPETPSRPTAMWYTDARLEIVGGDIFVATSMEPYMFNASREMTGRFVLPRQHKLAPGGGGGRPPIVEYSEDNKKPPTMPWWDNLRHQWRGLMTITMSDTCMKLDSQGEIHHLGGHGGDRFTSEIEVRADLWEITMRPKHTTIRCADFKLVRVQDDDVCTEVVQLPVLTPRHELVIFPVMCVEAAYEFTSVLDGGDGHVTHYRHDEQTGEEIFSRDLTRSTGCRVNANVSFASKEEYVQEMMNELEHDAFVQKVRDATVASPGAMRVEGYSSPTLALTPEDVAFVTKWKHNMQNPMIALRQIWNSRPWGTPRRVRHPDSISLPGLFKSIDANVEAKTLNIVNSTSDEMDDAYGACFCFQSLHCEVKKEPRTKVEFTLRADGSQFHVPERVSSIERKSSTSPVRVYRTASLNNRLNFSELDDVIKEMLQGSNTSPKSTDGGSRFRPNSTESTLVLDTRRMEIIQRADESVRNQGVQIEVDAPRILIEAERRDDILGWIRDIWAASKTQRREPTVTELTHIVSCADELQAHERQERVLDDMSESTMQKHDVSQEDGNEDSPKRMPDTKVLFVIQVSAPQINFKGKDAAGRMLLAAEGGLVVGRTIDNGGMQANAVQRLVTISLQQVQAYVAPTNVDLNAGVQWLKEKKPGDVDESFLVRDDVFDGEEKKQSDSLLRRIFAPGAIVFEYATAMSASHSSVTDEDLYAYDGPTAEGLLKSTARQDKTVEAMSEFSVRSPDIEAEMSSSQYVVLIDVMASLFLTPTTLDQPRPSFQAARLLMSRERTLFDRDRLASAAIVARPMLKLIAARWAAESAEKNYRRASCMSPNMKREVLASIDRLWQATTKAELKVLAAVQEAEEYVRLYRRRAAIRLNLQIEHASWTLLSGGKAFIAAELSRLTLSRERQIDSSGVTRFKLHGLSLVSLEDDHDEHMLSRWNPKTTKTSYRNEPLIDFFAVRAGSVPEKPIYDHLELSVQPFEINIKHAQYKLIYRYLFPTPAAREHDEFERVYKSAIITDGKETSPDVFTKTTSMNKKAAHLTPLEVSTTRGKHNRREWQWEDKRREVEEIEEIDGGGNKGIDHKIVLLRYFKLHSLHMKITYEGKTRTLRDIHISLDSFAYENFSGRWRDLTSELKNHIVWSVLKSLVGLRGKFVESKIDDKSVFKRVAERMKRKTPMLTSSASNASDDGSIMQPGASESEPPSTPIIMKNKQQTTEALEDIIEHDDGDADARVDPQFVETNAKKKPRRFRPTKNAKKYLAKLGIGSYEPSRRVDGSRNEVVDAWNVSGER